MYIEIAFQKYMFEKYAENALKRILLILLARYLTTIVSFCFSLFLSPPFPSICVLKFSTI